MKMPLISFLKRVAAIGICVTITGLFSACDKAPFFQGDSENGTEEQGIVQTDWQDTEKAKADPAAPSPDQDKKMALDEKTSAAPAAAIMVEKETKPAEYAVQIGAFLQADNATRLIGRLKKKGYNASLVVVETPAKKWNLVRIGSYLDKKSALTAARKFTTAEKMETAVVKDRAIVKMQAKSDLQEKKKKAGVKSTMPLTVAKFEPERFTYQVGGLRTKQNAEKHRRSLKKKGLCSVYQKNS